MKKIFKNKWFIGIMGFILLIIVIGSINGSPTTPTPEAATNEQTSEQLSAKVETDNQPQKNAEQMQAPLNEQSPSNPSIEPLAQDSPVQASPVSQSNNQQASTEIKAEAPVTTNKTLYTVSRVIDGDTIEVTIDGKVEQLRLIGMDTPETLDPRKPVQCFGKEASAKAKELLLNKKVELVSDPSGSTRDKYSRLLFYVVREDGLFYNKWMIENGYAHEYTYDSAYKYQSEFRAAQKTAEKNKVGFWSPDSCNGDTTSAVKETTATPSTETVQAPAGGHIYYTSSYRTSKTYYCDTDAAWKNLSKSYLESFSSESELLAKYPNKKLNEPCK